MRQTKLLRITLKVKNRFALTPTTLKPLIRKRTIKHHVMNLCLRCFSHKRSFIAILKAKFLCIYFLNVVQFNRFCMQTYLQVYMFDYLRRMIFYSFKFSQLCTREKFEWSTFYQTFQEIGTNRCKYQFVLQICPSCTI